MKEPKATLKRFKLNHILNFFRWYMDHYSVKKMSAIQTYNHQLSQLYSSWNRGEPINKKKQKRIYHVGTPPYDYSCAHHAVVHLADASERSQPLRLEA